MLDEWIIERKKIEDARENLRGADLSYAKLMKANLRKADFSEADLSFSYLMQADLSEANFAKADLSYAVISEAVLTGANLEEADISEAFLHGVDMSGVLNLTAEQIESAYIDRDTKFPEYIQITWTSENAFTCSEKMD